MYWSQSSSDLVIVRQLAPSALAGETRRLRRRRSRAGAEFGRTVRSTTASSSAGSCSNTRATRRRGVNDRLLSRRARDSGTHIEKYSF